MQYGYFDRKNKEFVIMNPCTPTAWINYLGMDCFCSIISANAGGFCFDRTPRDGRFTRYRYQSVPMDRPGKYLYLDDGKDIWSASWLPVRAEGRYKTFHGKSYTRIECKKNGIESKTTWFVPLGADCEVWHVRMKNTGKKIKKLRLTAYTEFAFWNTNLDLIDFQYTLNMAKVSTDRRDRSVEYSMLSDGKERFAYMTWDLPVESLCGNRDEFLGLYNDESQPDFVFNPLKVKCKKEYVGGQPAAALAGRIVLKPGEEKVFTVLVGHGRETGAAQKAKKYIGLPAVEKELKKISQYWEERQKKIQISFPDETVEDMINDLNFYQTQTTFNWSRSASMYESGTFRAGLGYRDSCQDLLAVIASDPARVRKRLVDLSKGIFADGSAAHTYQPLNHTCLGGHGYSDDHLWFGYSSCAYLAETDDRSYLKKKTVFFDQGEGSIQEHIERTFSHAWKNRGPHGLSLGLQADWNDCLNLKGGESVWTTELFYKTLTDYIQVCERYNLDSDVKKWKRYQNALKKAFQKYAWDGEWFIRGYTQKGKLIGSKKCKEGQIYLNSNTWAVISGLATPAQAERAMESVKKRLASKYGVKLLDPPYTAVDWNIGSITVYPPGMKENGGIFCHTNPWAVIAEVLTSNPTQAYSYYNRQIPLRYEEDSVLRKTEPYVYAQFIASPDSPASGEAKNSWLTGTASWNYVSFTQYLLGVRPAFDRLIIDPVLPGGIKQFSMDRFFQGVQYKIVYKKTGKRSCFVDGRELKNTGIWSIQRFKDNKIHNIDITF